MNIWLLVPLCFLIIGFIIAIRIKDSTTSDITFILVYALSICMTAVITRDEIHNDDQKVCIK